MKTRSWEETCGREQQCSGSVHACHMVAPGLIPVKHGIGLWRCVSHPSALETVYLPWLAWPCKWWCHLTDLKWSVKESQRMTSSLAVTTLTVHTCKLYTPYTCRALWHSDCGMRLWTEKSWVLASAGAVWFCVLGQDTSPACALSWPGSEWVPGWTVIACVSE